MLHQGAELGAEIKVGPEDLGGGGIDRGQIDGVADRAVEQHIGDLLGDLDADGLLGLGGRSPEVRRERDVGQTAQLAVLGQRLVFEHIETSGGNLTGFHRRDQGGFLDDPAAGTVEYPQALLRLRESRFVDHVFGIVGERHVDRDVVRLGQQFIQRDRLHLHGLGAAGCEIGIISHDAHAESLGALRDLAADAAKADDAEGFLEKLDAGKTLPIPLARLHGSRSLRHRPGAA